ncbi:putative lysozyme-like protein [Anopheles cruzii]|uniref:putative lysozyme-like protein n=1 Tax=Anopheles cruzii TaxID=68878 RepID=UPI0022EC4AFE|nr:putative lysozyme-like protein [Anopheles cruzii]
MACLSSSSRVCARVVQEKLCQLAAATSRSPSGLLQQQHSTAAGAGAGASGAATSSAAVSGSVIGGKVMSSMVSGGHSGFGQGSVGGGGGSTVVTVGKRTVLFPLFGSEPGIPGRAPALGAASAATVTTVRSFYSTAGDAASYTQPSSSSSSSSSRVKHLGVPVIGRRTPPAAVPLYDRSQCTCVNVPPIWFAG